MALPHKWRDTHSLNRFKKLDPTKNYLQETHWLQTCSPESQRRNAVSHVNGSWKQACVIILIKAKRDQQGHHVF